jgi:CBS domain-containing protein
MTHRRMSDVIHRPPVTLPPTATVQHACQEMHRQRVGAVLVVDEHTHLLGIFTGRDLVRLLAEGRDPAKLALDAVMTRDPEHLPPGHTAVEALRLMQDGGFRHVPVVEQGRVVGVVSHGDFRHFEHARLDEETGVWERL